MAQKRKYGSTLFRRWKAPTATPARKEPKTLPAAVWLTFTKLVKGTCLVLGAFLLFFIVLGMFIGGMADESKLKPMPRDMVLHLELESPLAEVLPKASLVDPFAGAGLTLPSVVAGLHKAATDTRVKAVIISLYGNSQSISAVQELREEIQYARSMGKKVFILSDDYGAGGAGGLGEYYLAAACNEIWMKETGILSLPGLGISAPYAKNVLDKLGVEPEFYQRKEYKNAMESFTATHMSEASKESLGTLVDSLAGVIVADIAKDRGLSPAEVKTAIDKGLLLPEQAIKSKLVDHLGNGAMFLDHLRREANIDAEIVSFKRYVKDVEPFSKGQSKVAFITLEGAIGAELPHDTKNDEEAVLSSSEVARALYEAAMRDDIKAVLLRIDSPGGTPAAAEEVRKAVLFVKEQGKPIYVSMGSTAASGGYWAAASADRIYALPGTLTGSIGVVGGKIVLGGLYKKIGINWDKVTYGANTDFWSSITHFTPEQQARFNAMLDKTYADFTAIVAEGRGLTPKRVEDIAKGRVWSGEQAEKRGLVDELGGFRDTLDGLATKLGYQGADDLALVRLPEPKSTWQEFSDLLEQSASLPIFFKNVMSWLNVFEATPNDVMAPPLELR
ncbi:MAG: signal peptide peptidase SppA [Pseudobdellovibrionaceae bacterium]